MVKSSTKLIAIRRDFSFHCFCIKKFFAVVCFSPKFYLLLCSFHIYCVLYVAHLAVSMPSEQLYIFDFMLFTVNSNWQTINSPKEYESDLYQPATNKLLLHERKKKKFVDSFSASFLKCSQERATFDANIAYLSQQKECTYSP